MNHPMEPTPEQFAKWFAEACRLHPDGRPGSIAGHVARLAYAAGANAELDACCGWIESQSEIGELSFIPEARVKFRCEISDRLRAARRPPKPPSLKHQAFKAVLASVDIAEFPQEYETICRAIEALPDDLEPKL